MPERVAGHPLGDISLAIAAVAGKNLTEIHGIYLGDVEQCTRGLMPESGETSKSSSGNPPVRDILKWVGQFVGLLGGGGAGFAAFAFGLGFLAIKYHDIMLGLPTTTTAYTSYVTTGSLFFVNTMHYWSEQ